jgi:hypothetical protein
MSGSAGGNTYSRNRFGAYMRNRTVPINPQSAAQSRARNAVGLLAQRWFSTLTAAQRAAWGTYADNVAMLNKLGEPIHITGFNHYIRSNSILSQQGQTLIDAAPVTMSLPDRDPSLAFTVSEATQLISLTFDDTLNWPQIDDGHMQIIAGRPVQGSREFYNGPWLFADLLDGNTAVPLTSPQTFTAPIAVAETNALWLQVRILEPDGRLSETMNVGPTLVGA